MDEIYFSTESSRRLKDPPNLNLLDSVFGYSKNFMIEFLSVNMLGPNTMLCLIENYKVSSIIVIDFSSSS